MPWSSTPWSSSGLTFVSVPFLCFVRARFSKSLIRKSTAALVQPSFIGSTTAPSKQKNKYRNDDSYIHYYLIIYLTKTTTQDNTLGIVFYNIFLWCIVSLSSILVFFLTSVKEGYIPEIQMLIKYSLLHFIYLCKQITINSALVLATTYDKCNVF